MEYPDDFVPAMQIDRNSCMSAPGTQLGAESLTLSSNQLLLFSHRTTRISTHQPIITTMHLPFTNL